MSTWRDPRGTARKGEDATLMFAEPRAPHTWEEAPASSNTPKDRLLAALGSGPAVHGGEPPTALVTNGKEVRPDEI